MSRVSNDIRCRYVIECDNLNDIAGGLSVRQEFNPAVAGVNAIYSAGPNYNTLFAENVNMTPSFGVFDVTHRVPGQAIEYVTSTVDMRSLPSTLGGAHGGRAFLGAIGEASQMRYDDPRVVSNTFERAGLWPSPEIHPSSAVEAYRHGVPAVLNSRLSEDIWQRIDDMGLRPGASHAIVGIDEGGVRVSEDGLRTVTVPHEDVPQLYKSGIYAENPHYTGTPFEARSAGAFTGAVNEVVRPLGGAVGAGMLASGFAQALSEDGVLPRRVGEALAPINQAVGSALAPLSLTQGVVGDAVRQVSGSHTASFGADLLAEGVPYLAASAFAGTAGTALLGGVVAAQYMAEKSEFAHAGRAAISGLSDLGIDTSYGTFGHSLSTELRGSTSGVLSNLPETRVALDNFGQLYDSAQQSGADLALQSSNGWGAADETRRDQLLGMQDLASRAAADENLVGGAIFYPDGTSASFQETSYTNALTVARANGYDGDDASLSELQQLGGVGHQTLPAVSSELAAEAPVQEPVRADDALGAINAP
jgi:hypothetical protein